MPGLDGFEVCRRVKESTETKGTRIIAITGFTDDQAEGMALACGADAFVSKQAGFEVLGRRVKALLDVATGRTRSSRPRKTAREKRR